ncbi:MAG: CDP-diacylglycerol--glycerol-3-phosphate 3-phosphatidyltransferase [candidate division NC10 bacterium]|nr:CDP-diacylglycerol--glycerol-3-phosphate 3-phosphatidyltransferase [candidate division NC10 bacterium]
MTLKRRALNLPNKLTLIRIFLVPFLMVFLLISNSRPFHYTAALIFIAAVITDWLDGHIARSTSQVTTLGQLLDPIADKLLIAAALISLVQVGRVPAWMVVLIVGRDIVVTGLRGIAASQGLIIQASDLGKYKMVFETSAVVFLILNWPSSSQWPSLTPGIFLLWVAMGLAIVSGVDYFIRFWARIDLGR